MSGCNNSFNDLEGCENNQDKEKEHRTQSDHYEKSDAKIESLSSIGVRVEMMPKGSNPTTFKMMLLIPPPMMPDIRKSNNKSWVKKIGIRKIVEQDWNVMGAPKGVEEILRKSIDSYVVVAPRRVLV